MDQGVLLLQVDTILDEGLSIDCTRIGINSVPDSPDSVHPLSNPATIPDTGVVSCPLDMDLTITIATDPSFSSDILHNTFTYINSGTGITAEGQELHPDMFGRQVGEVIVDQTPPLLVSFDLDLDGDVLTLTFSEPVRIDSFMTSGIVIQSSLVEPAASVRLTEQSVPQGSSSDIVILQLNGDAQSLKVNTLLATSSHNTFLSLASNTAADLFGNEVVGILSNALMVSNYTEDTTSPILQSFTLDVDSNQLVLNFTEPVLASSINSSALILSNHPVAPTVQITNMEIVVLSTDSDSLIGDIVGDALCLIKANSTIGNDETDTILSVQDGAVLDTNGNSISDQTIMGMVVGDESSPSLVSFALDMDNGVILLTFDDAIDVDSQSVSGAIAIQRAPSDLNPYFLEGGVVTGEECMVVKINLLQTDLNVLKTTSDLAVSISSTFIVINDTALRDLSGNYIIAIGNGQALAASVYIVDITAPKLETFDLDLNVGELILIFDEPIDVNSLNISAFSLIWNQTGDSLIFYTLTGGQISFIDTDIPTILLTIDDLGLIKCFINVIAGSFNNTYLQASLGAVSDIYGNIIGETSVPAQNVIGDITPPQLIAFDLDMNLGVISLSFDEPVDPSTLVVTQISLQNAATNMASSLTLSGGSTTSTTNTIMDINLTVNDLNAIKVNPELATNINDTFIALGEGCVEDCAGNLALSIPSTSALHISSYITDITSPELLSFDLDLDEGTLVLYFDEPVDTATLDVSGITIQNAASLPTVSLTFTTLDQAIPNHYSHTVTIPILSEDLLALQNIDDIAVNSNSTYLSMTNATITDVNYNPLLGILTEDAFMVDEFIPAAPYIFDTVLGANFVTVFWSNPIGPTINSYIITGERDSTGECSDEDEESAFLNAESTSYTVTGLEEDSNYTITVTGISAFASAVSDPVTITTSTAGKSLNF